MFISFSGPHRTGKTTTAQAVADKLGIPFVKMNVAALHEKYGFSVRGISGWTDRMQFQTELVNEYITLSKQQQGVAIIDRCPIDFAAYTHYYIRGLVKHLPFAEASKAAIKLHALTELCMTVTQQTVAHIALFPPIAVGPESDKAEAIDAISDVNNALKTIVRLLSSKYPRRLADVSAEKPTEITRIPQEMTGFEQRVTYLSSILEERLKQL